MDVEQSECMFVESFKIDWKSLCLSAHGSIT